MFMLPSVILYKSIKLQKVKKNKDFFALHEHLFNKEQEFLSFKCSTKGKKNKNTPLYLFLRSAVTASMQKLRYRSFFCFFYHILIKLNLFSLHIVK